MLNFSGIRRYLHSFTRASTLLVWSFKVLLKAVLVVTLLASGACSGPGTKVQYVWGDPASTGFSLGQTLVIVYTRQPAVGNMVESVIVQQLQSNGVAAIAWHNTVPGSHGPTRSEVLPVATAGGFNSVLTVNVLDVKKVQRDYPATQVARGETRVFDVATHNLVWEMVTDTYFRTHYGVEIIMPEVREVEEFSRKLIEEMRQSKLI